ncbi:MAG: aldose 1-epimerase family protein [Eubacteriales bacterium]|nr:aldose 1-epimerase family protein [Eubacteriales bacterium]
MQKITNDVLTVEILEKGAELQSVKNADGKEFLWNGDPAYWVGRAPVLFPICGGLKEDKYTLNGSEYTLSKHGFAKLVDYDVEDKKEDSVTFLLKSNEETKKQFPFNFELRITYSLKDNSLITAYAVKNLDADKMYFSIGSHEAFMIPEGTQNYHIQFDKEVTLNSYILDGNLLEDNYITVLEKGDKFPLKDEYFAVDALVFKNVDFDKAALVCNDGSRKVTVEFPGCDYFLLWKKPEANYLCLEPWAGVQDIIGSDYDITKKEGIIALDGNGIYEKVHTITFE